MYCLDISIHEIIISENKCRYEDHDGYLTLIPESARPAMMVSLVWDGNLILESDSRKIDNDLESLEREMELFRFIYKEYSNLIVRL